MAAGATWTDPVTGHKLKSGCYADIHHPIKPDFREYVTIFHDESEVYDKNGNRPIMPEAGEHDMTMSINYRSEPMRNRQAICKECFSEEVSMSSWSYGDPATPLFEAYVNDPIKIRLLMPADKPRNHSFVLHGHVWKQQYSDPFSDIVASQGSLSVGDVLNITLKDGANMFPGDYAYRSGVFRWDVEQGMWGIFRIYDRYKKGLAPINGNNLNNGYDCDYY